MFDRIDLFEVTEIMKTAIRDAGIMHYFHEEAIHVNGNY